METAQQSSATDVETLEERIGLLTELSTRVETLRKNPAYIRPPAASIGTTVSAATQASLLTQGFEHIQQFTAKVVSDSVQEVLKKAQESESNDKTDLNFTHRRKNLKRRWVFPLNCA
jgi:hypothetical protein